LKKLELSVTQATKLRGDWLAWIASDDRDQAAKSIDLRIDQAESRLTRLTDLLIDNAITQDDFNARKQALKLELAALVEDQTKLDRIHLFGAKMDRFIELMKNLAGLHESTNPTEKRSLVENCFSNRTISPKGLCLEPSNWLTCRDFAALIPLVTHNDPDLELLSPKVNSKLSGSKHDCMPQPLIRKPDGRYLPERWSECNEDDDLRAGHEQY